LRFEAGLDRRAAIDALNDHMLSLRFMLEGDGPAGVGLPMRAAALAVEAPERDEIKRLVEEAISLERQLWSGEPATVSTPIGEIAAGIEDLLRTILRRTVSGELGNDLRAAADETLLADGLAVGAGSERGSTTEWDLEPVVPGDSALDQPEQQGLSGSCAGADHGSDSQEAFEQFEREADPEIVASRPEQDERAVPDPRCRPEPETGVTRQIELPAGAGRQVAPRPERTETEPRAWLAEVSGPDETMDFPARSDHLRDLARPPMDREEVKARVEYLFPRTETDWTVGGGAERKRAAAG
jgi:hypothetical protein